MIPSRKGEIIQQLNLISGKTKEEIAIEFIRQHEPPEGYAMMYSGGKDSTVLEDVTIRSGVKYKRFYSLMPDPPELIQFVRSRPFEINILRPEFSFWHGIVKNYPPHRRAAWCCTDIKEKPSVKVGFTYRLLGVRQEERKRTVEWIEQRTKKRINYHPLLDWLEWEIWEYIEKNNLEYCSLYDEGFSRLGCIVCPKRSTPDLMRWKTRYPQYFKLFEKKVEQWWCKKGFHRQRTRGYSYFYEEFLNNWYRGK